MKNRPADFSEVTDDAQDARARRTKSHITLKGAAVLAMLVAFGGQVERAFAGSSVNDGAQEGTLSPEEEKAFEQLAIARIENNFAGLGRYILTNLDTYVEDEVMKEKIRSIFGIFYENLENPERNTDDGRAVRFGEEKGFGIHLAPTKYYERFNGISRRITLSEYFNPNDIAQLAILGHALTHVEQDDDYRATVPWSSYRSFYNSRGLAAVLQDEVDAVTRSIVILNVATNGAIEKSAKRGEFPQIPTSDPNIATALGRCAAVYYSNPGDLPGVVREMILKDGRSQFFSKQLQPIGAY